jgi:phosphoribosylglycinamide formyltransferase-1
MKPDGMKPCKVAVFASGSGSNFQHIAELAASGELDIRVDLLVSDRPDAFAVERARRLGIDTFTFTPRDYPSREAYERVILQVLQEREIDFVVLAGYMRIVTDVLVQPYFGRMINLHPSLLPAFPGVNGARQALEYGVKVTGATVHFVDSGLDSGPIIAQKAVDIRDDDTEETLLARIHAAEREILPLAIRWLREGRLKMEGRRVFLSAEPKEDHSGH